jgi:5S rRNA maturation endonuclease (ribonuclease M5)
MEELINELKKLKESNKLIIVEGKKDIISLKSLGINNVIEIKGSLEIFSEEIAKNNKEVILLTDLDEEGKKLFRKLNSYLCQQGVNINNDFRNFLFRKTKLKQIEGLSRYSKIKEDI